MADPTLKPFNGKLDAPSEGPWTNYGKSGPDSDGPWNQYAGLKPFEGSLDGEKPKRSLTRSVGDSAIALGTGVVQGVKMLADVAGADNAVSRGLGKAADELSDLESPYRKAQKQERAAKIKAAEASGSTWEEVKAHAGAFADAPIDTTLNAIGTSVPTLATAAIPGLGQAALATRAAQAGVGIAQGVGGIKGQIHETVKQKLMTEGVSESEASQRADAAQAYGGGNMGSIALGGALGGLAGGTGAESAARRLLGRQLAGEAAERAAPGLVRAAVGGVLKEAPMEAVQGGQERLAGNLALQGEGFDVPTWQGVAGQAALEGLASAPMGGGFGLADGLRARAEAQARQQAEANAQQAQDEQRSAETQAAQTSAMVRADTLAQEESAPPEVQQTTPPDGRVILDARRAESRAQASPDDEIYQSTGADVAGASPVSAAPIRQEMDQAEPDQRTPSQRMGIDPAAGPLSKAAAASVDSGASQEAQFLAATGRDLQVRRTGPGVADDSNVIDVQGRVVEDRAIGTQRRLTAQESARESGAIAFREGVPRSEIAAIPNIVARAEQLRGYDDAAQKASSVPALPAPTNLSEGLERIRAQRQEAANAQAAARQAAAAAQTIPAARPGAVEAAGPATIPATTGVARESQASQAQQGSTQPTQAGGPQAGAATATASTSPAGGNRVQAAGLTNGAPTQNPGAQAAPAPGAQAQAPGNANWAALTPEQRRRARLEHEIATGQTNNGGVVASLRPSAIEKRKQELAAMGDAGKLPSPGQAEPLSADGLAAQNPTAAPASQAQQAAPVAEQAAPKPDSTVTTMRSLAQQFRDRHAVTKKDTDRTFAEVLDQFAQDVEQGKRTPQSVQQAIERYQELAAEPVQATQKLDARDTQAPATPAPEPATKQGPNQPEAPASQAQEATENVAISSNGQDEKAIRYELPATDVRLGDKVMVDGDTYTVTGPLKDGRKSIGVVADRDADKDPAAGVRQVFLRGDDAIRAKLAAQSQPAPATHADPGQSPEVATPAVVAQSVQKAARNEDTKPSEMRKWLVGKIDEAIAVAPEAAVDFLSFDVPGDGTFKVQNSQARLQEFRKKVLASPGFKDGGQKQAKPQQNDSILNGGGTAETIHAFLVDGDVQGAVEFAKLKGVEFTPVPPQMKMSADGKGKVKHMPASVKSSVPSVAEGLTQVEAEQLNQYLTAENAIAEQNALQSPQDGNQAYSDGQQLGADDLLAYFDQVIAGSQKGEKIANPRFQIGEVDAGTAQEIANYIDGYDGQQRRLRVSGRTLKHIHESRPAIAREIVEQLPGMFSNPDEVLPDPKHKNKRALLVKERKAKESQSKPKSYVATVEVEIEVEVRDGFIDIVTIMTAPDRSLREARELKKNWPEGQQRTEQAVNSPHPLTAEAANPEADSPDARPAGVSVPPTAPAAQPITRADVETAKKQAAAIITERIDAMTAGEVNTIARRFLPTMGVRPTVSKERNKAAVTDFTKVNPLAAADEFGATLPADVRRALQADMEGTAADGLAAAKQGLAAAKQEPGKPILASTIKTKETDKGVAMFSSADSNPPAKPLSLDRVNQLVQEAMSGIRGAPPVEAVGSPADIGFVVSPNTVHYGVTLRSGDIYVFQSAMGSDLDVLKTVFHELFHRGVRVLVPKSQYVQTMLDLAKGDSRIQQYAMRWKNSDMADAQKENLRRMGYAGSELTAQFEALAIEEALADVAEEIKAEGKLGSKPKSMTIRYLANWLAKLADLAGMKKLAAGIRAMTYNQAERFVMSAIDRSGEPVQAGRTDNMSAKQATPGTDQTQTEAFKRWFAGSKAVDSEGKPLVGRALAVAMYQRGASSATVAKALGDVSVATVKRWVSDAGVQRSASEARGGTKENRADAVRLYGEGLGAFEIANRLGVSNSGVYNWLRDAGVEIRSMSEAQALRAAQGRQPIRGVRSTVSTKWGDVRTDSVYEAARLRQLEADPDVESVARATESIKWGDNQRYTPDFLVKMNDGRVRVEEVKPTFQQDRDDVVAKAEAAREALGDDVDYKMVVTEDLASGFIALKDMQGLSFASDTDRGRFKRALATAKSAIGNNGNFDPDTADIRFRSANTAGVAGSAWDAPVQTGFDDVIYKLQDKNIDLKRVVESITKSVGQVADSINAYLKEELFHKRAAKRVADFGARELKPLMNQMRLAGLSMEDVEEYLHARHAKEANAVIAQRNPGNAGLQDGGSGMTNAAADNYFSKLDPTQRRKLEAVAKSVDAIIDDTRKLYVSYGLEDQAVVDGWTNMYQHYIPLMREDKDGGMGTGQGFSVKGKETKGRTGSTRKVVDILANVAMQREKLIVRGEKNIVAQALVGLAQANPNPDFWEVRSQAPTERVFDPKTGVVVDRPDPLFKSRENVAVAKVKDANGKVTEQMVVFNEDNPRAVRMAAAMKNLDAGNLEGLLGVSAKITRYFAAINTQYNPVFGVVNLVRDVQGAMVNLGTTPLAGQQGKIAKDTLSALRGIYGDIRKTRKGGQATSQWSQLWEQMQDDGGTTGYRDLFKTSADRANDLKSILNPEGWMDSKWGKFFTADGRLRVPMSMAQKGATEIFGWLSDYNEAMENGVRLAAYKAALDKGMSREQAASLAKNLTVNFNRKGQAGQQAGAVYAFFNAAMQGTARIGQTLFDMDGGDLSTLRLSKTGKAVVYGGVMLGVMQALALSAAGFDDDDPPEFVRERSLIIPTGDKTYVSIPMPLGLHVIPGIGRHATEFALSGFDKPAKRAVSMVGMFADAFNPIGNAGLSMQTIAPTALDPLVALSENKDWTGKPIARVSSNKAMPGHTQWKDTATEFSKVVAEAINWISGGNEYVAGAFSPTPDQIDYLLAQVGGGVAREAAKVQQTITTALSGETLPTHKIPLVGRFVGNAASQASQGSAFYANLNKLNELETEIKGLRKDGRFDEASKLIRENPQAIMIQMANRAERDVQRLRREKRELIANDASREQVRAKEDQITDVMTRLNEAVERRKAQAAR